LLSVAATRVGDNAPVRFKMVQILPQTRAG
jgi:hypothetical protein